MILKEYRVALMLMLVLISSSVLMSCGGGTSTPTKIKSTLLKVAEAENAAAKTNHALYESGVYGAKGSPSAIKIRQKVATGIYDSNEGLIVALDVAKGITSTNFAQSKLQILSLLAQAAASIAAANIGDPRIDLALQAIAALINDAVVLVNAVKSADLRDIQRAIPTLNRIQNQLREVYV